MLVLLSVPIRSEVRFPAPYVGSALNGIPCGGDPKGYGPFDYSKRHEIRAYDLEIVEGAHFTPEVENLIKGKTSGTPWGDLDYTLKAWPNHHRALLSIIRYKLQIISKLRRNEPEVVPECYLQRAINFSPKDAASYSLYAYYLYKRGYLDRAEKFYQKAIELGSENIKFRYSYGLLLIDLKRYDDAKIQANYVYKQKNAPSGLKNKLIKLGYWGDIKPDDLNSREADKHTNEK